MNNNNDDRIRVYQIVEEIYKDGLVDRLLRPFSTSLINKEDFLQDVHIILMEYKNPSKIVEMYKKKQLQWFLFGIIKNNLVSRNSPFYKHYSKYEEMIATDFEIWSDMIDNDGQLYKGERDLGLDDWDE